MQPEYVECKITTDACTVSYVRAKQHNGKCCREKIFFNYIFSILYRCLCICVPLKKTAFIYFIICAWIALHYEVRGISCVC